MFWSVPFQYPPLVYLFARLVMIGCGRARRAAYTTRWPVWLVAGVAVFAMGFRAGLNFWSSNVIDVGYASVAGADRLLQGTIPYDHMPRVTVHALRAEVRRRLLLRLQAGRRHLRVARRARRHLRAGDVRRLRADDGRARLVGAVGRPARGARHGGAVRRAGGGRPRVRRLAARPRAPRGDPAVLLGDVPVHHLRDVVQLERPDHRRADRVDARPVHVPVLARAPDRVRRLGQVRAAAARADAPARRPPARRRTGRVGVLDAAVRRSCTSRPGRPRIAERLRPGAGGGRFLLGLAGRDRAGVRDAGRARRPVRAAHVLDADVRLAARPAVAVLRLGLGRLPRASPTWPSSRSC